MKTVLSMVFLVVVVSAPLCYAGSLDNLMKTASEAVEGGSLSDDAVISGLKEALTVSARKAVDSVSRVDGYYGNADIRIPFPLSIGKVAKVLEKVGYRKHIDAFVLSMNRAAEKAALEAADLFVDAVKEMSFEDAKSILRGDDTAATEYLRKKTSDRLYKAFKPIVSSSMDEVGAARLYKELVKRYVSVPFVKEERIDLDHYVTGKALEGLFHVVGEEEKRIRTDPEARITALLREVFGG